MHSFTYQCINWRNNASGHPFTERNRVTQFSLSLWRKCQISGIDCFVKWKDFPNIYFGQFFVFVTKIGLKEMAQSILHLITRTFDYVNSCQQFKPRVESGDFRPTKEFWMPLEYFNVLKLKVLLKNT